MLWLESILSSLFFVGVVKFLFVFLFILIVILLVFISFDLVNKIIIVNVKIMRVNIIMFRIIFMNYFCFYRFMLEKDINFKVISLVVIKVIFNFCKFVGILVYFIFL